MGDFDDRQWLDQVDWGLNVWTRGQEYDWMGRVPGPWALVTELVPGPVQGRRIRGPDVVEEGQWDQMMPGLAAEDLHVPDHERESHTG